MFRIVTVFGHHNGAGVRIVLVRLEVVGFDDDVDRPRVSLGIVEHQGHGPGGAGAAAGDFGDVGLAEGHGRVVVGAVAHAACHGAAVPRGRSVKDPIRRQGLGGRGRETEGEVGVALHVAQFVLVGSSVDFRNVAVDGQIKAVAPGTESVGVWRHLVGEHVAQQRERGTVRASRDRRDVHGGHDHAAVVVGTDAENGLAGLNGFGLRAQEALEGAAGFHEAATLGWDGTLGVLGGAQHGRGHGGVGVKALEVRAVHVVQDGVEGVSDVEVRVADLRAVRGTALDVHVQGQALLGGGTKPVDLVAVRRHVGLNRLS